MVYCVFRVFGVVHHIWFACVLSWGGGGGGGLGWFSICGHPRVVGRSKLPR